LTSRGQEIAISKSIGKAQQLVLKKRNYPAIILLPRNNIYRWRVGCGYFTDY
jgi:hypothetical protein